MNRKYNLKLDLQFRCNNSIMKFNQFDNNTSDFFIKISNGGKSFDVEKAIVVLAVIKPSGKVASQFIEVKNGLVYVDLKPNMKDEIGTYTAQAMLILEDERVVTDSISYEVEEDKIFSLLNDTVEDTEDFTLLTDMLNRLSTIEISEEQRVINEAERILSEENRKIEEAKRVEAELIRQHEEADRTKYDAIRESNENIRKQNESIRLANETNRIDEEAKRVEEEDKRKLAEEERNANYNFMTEDEERRRSEANAHKEAEALRVSAENTRVNEEAKRRTTEQGRISAENIRVSNENTRKANEVTRQTNETQRIEAETQRQSRYNSFIADAEANANNFENYTNNAKVKEEERKSNELDRKSQEARRVSNEVERISNENTRKANEKAREKNETSRQNIFENKADEVDKKIIELNTIKDNFVSSINTKVDTKISELDNTKSDMTNTVTNKIDEVENRFNALTSKQQQDAEVIDARDGETSLKARLDRDIEKAKQLYVNVEGSNISTDSSVGYAKDVEILGNTIQSASNLADIRSTGDKVEGQELYEIPVLSRGKNLFNDKLELGALKTTDGESADNGSMKRTASYVKVKPNTKYVIQFSAGESKCNVFTYDKNKKFISYIGYVNSFTTDSNTNFIRFYNSYANDLSINIQLEEGTVATPYEPYIEDKLTILSPVQLEKVGDVRDRIICKDGVWGVEKHIKTDLLKGGSDEGFGLNKALPKGGYQFTWFANMGATANKNSEVISSTMNSYVVSNEEYSSNIWIYDGVAYVIHHPTISTADEIKLWLQANPTIVKFALNTPQFIPLPHNQQIKLRTFAGKTNISFLTEIEGTIKAQVPKSLGATVNTHTEQISNLNKELDRVKKLEESTVSTITTESDFTTVEATSGGYFEDVKLEGKTLINLFNFKAVGIVNEVNIYGYAQNYELTKGKEVTLVNNTDKVVIYDISKDSIWVRSYILNANTCIKATLEESEYIRCCYGAGARGWDANSESDKEKIKKTCIVLEGDHTQNLPNYFEGLKSVGQSGTTSEDGADEIVVSSVNSDETQSDKKQLLYYNNETQAWEKPTLREWDSIEKHADGKYYYHQRSAEVVLNGSENWNNDTNSSTMSPATYRQSIQFDAIDIPSASFNTKTSPNIISDLLPTVIFGDVYSYNHIGISISGTDSIGTHIIINNNFTDVTELKQWLQANNLTVVYQLAEEKVYECTNIDLITYNGETNFIVESGVLSPKTTLKVHNNISNVVSLLQKKVSLLESNITSYMITQNRLMLASRYNADNVTFKVDYPSMMSEREVEIDYDLFKLIQDNIIVGPENYDVDKMLEIMDLYAMIGFITWEMWDYLYEVIDSQINPVIGDLEGAPEI